MTHPLKAISSLGLIAATLIACSLGHAQTATPATVPDVLPQDMARSLAEPGFRPFAELWKRAKADITDPQVGHYIGTYVQETSWTQNGVKTPVVMPENRAMATCFMQTRPELRPTKARVVFEIDATGMVKKAHTDLTAVYTALDACVNTISTGQRVPPPPKAPLAYCAVFEMVNPKESTVSFCNDPVPAAATAAAPK